MPANPPTNYYHYRRTARRPPVKQHPKLPKKKFLGLAVLTLLILGVYLYARWSNTPFGIGGQPGGSSRVTAVAKPSLSASQAAAMASQINAVITAHPDMNIGVAIEDLNTEKSYHYGVSEPFIAASISKILTATLFLHKVENGQQTLSEAVGGYTAQYELQQLIEVSDDNAWANLNDLLTHDALLAYARQIGLTNYDPDQNTLSVGDISLLLSKLYKNELLNDDHTNLLMTYMHDANYDNWIVASVPTGVKIYHKIGFLDDRMHDAAIIDNGKHPYVLVIFTKMADGSDYDSDEGHQVFAAITTASVQAFL
jgi:beta-lactamase class A